LILASRSPRRKELLESAGFTAVVAPSDAEELEDHPESPRHLAEANAAMKAMVLAAQHPEDVILAADTIVVLHGEVFGKPASMEAARNMLARLSGQTHEVITGVCILCSALPLRVQFEESTRVRFRLLSDAVIDDYLQTIDPLDKAGAYAAQDDAGRLIEHIEGCLSNVIGLPMDRTKAALTEHFPELFQPAGSDL